ncbi:DUF1656 domain-containing protein [Methylobacterium sp. ID0610]|uniref:DUF1656 domain-containing protein n=1 Tax=Methylobacterium carpenticola TaxID=3344827 RepID=UPI0036C9E478
MILPLREIDLMGVFVSPFALCLPAAAAGTWAALAALRRVRPTRASVPGAVLELALFTSLLSGLVLLLGRL